MFDSCNNWFKQTYNDVTTQKLLHRQYIVVCSWPPLQAIRVKHDPIIDGLFSGILCRLGAFGGKPTAFGKV